MKRNAARWLVGFAAVCLTGIIVWMVLNQRGATSAFDTTAILDAIEKTNLDSTKFPWLAGIAHSNLKRWDIANDGPIPVKFNGVVLAEMAADEIETKLGQTLFDRISIADTPDDLVTRGIIVSEGTAVGRGGVVRSSTCGNVSQSPGDTAYPPGFYDATGVIDTRLYVNLSSAKCTADLDIAIHEFGHALGLGRHFKGFGDMFSVIDDDFWLVLYNIYTNEIGATRESLAIQPLP